MPTATYEYSFKKLLMNAVEVRTYPDKAVMEMESDETGGNAGVVGEGGRDGLPHQCLGAGARRVVEAHLQLRAGVRRQKQA
jgi:hypothetical protein